MRITRRGAMIGAALAVIAAAGAGGLRHIFGRWYPPTPYDDLLHQIVDREPAAALGRAVLADGPKTELPALAAQLRQPGFALGRRARSDAAAGRVVEVQGWVVPQSVALYALLAAKV